MLLFDAGGDDADDDDDCFVCGDLVGGIMCDEIIARFVGMAMVTTAVVMMVVATMTVCI